MSKLKITEGNWGYLFLQGSDTDYYSLQTDEQQILIAKTEDEAKLIADAGNTYQKCGLLPSELLKENQELREALDKISKALQSDMMIEVDIVQIAEKALTKEK